MSLKNHIGKLLWIRAVACDGAECKLAWTDSPDNEIIRGRRGKTGIWEGICLDPPEKGGEQQERGLSQRAGSRKRDSPLSPKAEQRSRGGDQIDMVNWIDEGNLPAKIRPENQKRETRQGRNKARALGNEGTKLHEESALAVGERPVSWMVAQSHIGLRWFTPAWKGLLFREWGILEGGWVPSVSEFTIVIFFPPS